jgi:hypothetical protein
MHHSRLHTLRHTSPHDNDDNDDKDDDDDDDDYVSYVLVSIDTCSCFY